MAVQAERVGALALAMEASMDKREIEELQDPETWDPDSDQVLPPAEDPKVVVPVVFTPAEFKHVARFAREQSVTTSQSIHDAILASIEQADLAKRSHARS